MSWVLVGVSRETLVLDCVRFQMNLIQCPFSHSHNGQQREHTFVQGGTFYAIHSGSQRRLWLCHSPKTNEKRQATNSPIPLFSPSPSASGNLAMYANCWRQRNDQKQNFLTLNELPDRGKGSERRARVIVMLWLCVKAWIA